MRARGEAQDSPRIVGRTVWRGAFFAESVERIEDADRVYVGGDFTIGRASTPLKPDAEALAAGNPALFERLEALGRLSATVIVDREGRVRRVRFPDDVDQDLRRPFLEVLDAARFDATTHFERGPVLVELQIDYFINPPAPRQSLYEPGQASGVDSGSGFRGLRGPFPDAGDLVELLSYHVGMPVVDRTTGTPDDPFHVRLHPSAERTQRLDLLIRNLESQTDLDIEIVERSNRIMVVSPS